MLILMPEMNALEASTRMQIVVGRLGAHGLQGTCAGISAAAQGTKTAAALIGEADEAMAEARYMGHEAAIWSDHLGRSVAVPAPRTVLVAEDDPDVTRVVEAQVGEGSFFLGGHSMGAHTAVAYALRHPERLAGLVLVGPVYTGAIEPDSLDYWDGLATALETGGVDGFVAYVVAEQARDPRWRDSVERFTRERMLLQRHPEALARALREVPRSRPFESMEELRALDVPALVVGSNDDADPGHPHQAAAAYAEALPNAQLISEVPGESPLAWQGGKLSRALAAFYAEALSSSP
jgi:pimeloyl-ACP methyl ester carboxylesterase